MHPAPHPFARYKGQKGKKIAAGGLYGHPPPMRLSDCRICPMKDTTYLIGFLWLLGVEERFHRRTHARPLVYPLAGAGMKTAPGMWLA